MSAPATIPAPAIQPPDYIGLRPGKLPSDLSAPIATWNKRDCTVTVREGAVESVWSGRVVFVDGRPGQGVGYELVGVECESVTPDDAEPSEAAKEAADALLCEYAAEIGAGR